jgi:ubiquinone/menaquinone biosynthesis C-methylase UbiE
MSAPVELYYDRLAYGYEQWGRPKNTAYVPSLHFGYYPDPSAIGWSDGKYTPAHFESLYQMSRELVMLAALKSGDTLIDAGCGYGYLTALHPDSFEQDNGLSRRLLPEGVKTLSVNISAHQLEELAHQQADNNNRIIESTLPVRADYNILPVPTGRVDAIIASDSLGHADNPLETLTEFARVLKTGGKLVIGDTFLKKSANTNPQIKLILDKFNTGWKYSSLAIEEIRSWLEYLGMKVTVREVSNHVLPSVRVMKNSVIDGRRTKPTTDRVFLENNEACVALADLYEKGITGYFIIEAEYLDRKSEGNFLLEAKKRLLRNIGIPLELNDASGKSVRAVMLTKNSNLANLPYNQQEEIRRYLLSKGYGLAEINALGLDVAPAIVFDPEDIKQIIEAEKTDRNGILSKYVEEVLYPSYEKLCNHPDIQGGNYYIGVALRSNEEVHALGGAESVLGIGFDESRATSLIGAENVPEIIERYHQMNPDVFEGLPANTQESIKGQLKRSLIKIIDSYNRMPDKQSRYGLVMQLMGIPAISSGFAVDREGKIITSVGMNLFTGEHKLPKQLYALAQGIQTRYHELYPGRWLGLMRLLETTALVKNNHGDLAFQITQTDEFRSVPASLFAEAYINADETDKLWILSQLQVYSAESKTTPLDFIKRGLMIRSLDRVKINTAVRIASEIDNDPLPPLVSLNQQGATSGQLLYVQPQMAEKEAYFTQALASCGEEGIIFAVETLEDVKLIKRLSIDYPDEIKGLIILSNPNLHINKILHLSAELFSWWRPAIMTDSPSRFLDQYNADIKRHEGNTVTIYSTSQLDEKGAGLYEGNIESEEENINPKYKPFIQAVESNK